MKIVLTIILSTITLIGFCQMRVTAIVINGDTLPYVRLKHLVVEEKGNWGVFDNWERKRLEKKVRKVLPLVKVLSRELNNRKENLNSPNPIIRKKELYDLEVYLKSNYGKTIKDLTIGEGKVLLKLIHRENGMSPYEILKTLKGERKADFWDGFAGLFGTNLESKWDPEGEDKMLNQVVNKVEND